MRGCVIATFWFYRQAHGFMALVVAAFDISSIAHMIGKADITTVDSAPLQTSAGSQVST